jgi:hypothetical protein
MIRLLHISHIVHPRAVWWKNIFMRNRLCEKKRRSEGDEEQERLLLNKRMRVRKEGEEKRQPEEIEIVETNRAAQLNLTHEFIFFICRAFICFYIHMLSRAYIPTSFRIKCTDWDQTTKREQKSRWIKWWSCDRNESYNLSGIYMCI